MFSDSLNGVIRENEPLAPFTSLNVGGSAKYFAEAASLDVLQLLWAEANRIKVPIRLLGGGSNLLVRPGVVDALVIKLVGDFLTIHGDGPTLIAGAGATLGELIAASAEKGLAGLEHLAGIPGTVGGAVVCNSGVKNDDIGSHVRSVQGLTRSGELVDLSRDSLRFGYRRSNMEDVIVCSVELALEELSSEEVTRRVQSNWIVKKAGQPPVGTRCVQAFIEPSEGRISDLLEAAGMKTAADGDASMNSQFPGYLTVSDEATANDVLALTQRISKAVEVQSGIQLQSQLKIW